MYIYYVYSLMTGMLSIYTRCKTVECKINSQYYSNIIFTEVQ